MSTADSATAGPPLRNPWWGAGILISATALSLLNSTIVNVALPAIREGLRLTSAGVSWVMAGWALAYAIALVPSGRLGDRIGHRQVFITGITLFVITSIACGFAQNEVQLVLFRIAQGVAGGMFYPAIGATLSSLFNGPARSRAFAIMGATIGVAAAIGPLLGGVLVDTLPGELGWRSVFLVNAPLGLAIVLGALRWLPRKAGAARGAGGSDPFGLLLLTLALAGLFVPLIIGQDLGWPAWLWLVMVAGIAVLVGFLLWESRVDRSGRLPLVPPRLFALPRFTVPVVISFVQFAGFVAIFYVLALLWQSGLGRTALEMGLLTLPEAVGSIVGSWALVRILPRLGLHTITLGSALMVGGITGIWGVLNLVPATDLSSWGLLLPLFIMGVGVGLTITSTLNVALAAVEPRDAGGASGLVATMQRLGNGAGLAIVGAVFFATLASVTPSPEGYASATANALLVSIGFTGIGLVLALVLVALDRHRPTGD